MKTLIYRVVSIVSAAIILISNLSCFSVYAEEGGESDADAVTSWLSCTISQHGCNGRDNSCTGCSTMMVLQNCGLLTDESWQWGSPGNRVCISDCSVKSNGGKSIEDFAMQCSTIGATTRSSPWWWGGGNGVNSADLSKWTDGKLKSLSLGSSELSASGFGSEASTPECLVGLNGKDFQNMTHDELLEAFKLMWNAGLFVIVCGGAGGSNSIGAYSSKHASNLAGVSDSEIYIADVWDGLIYPVNNWQGGKIVYCLCYISDETSPIELCGGTRTATAMTHEDESGNLHLDGFKDEDGFISEVHLAEGSIMIADYESLVQKDKVAVRDWSNDIKNKHKMHKYDTLRAIVAFLGVLICVYSVVLYVAYHFDCVNNFIDVNMLEVLTFGRLVVSPDVKTGTAGSSIIEKAGKHTVNHTGILKVVCVGIGVGVLLVSGGAYKLILWIITLIKEHTVSK